MINKVCGQDKKNTLFVFVGEKIFVNSFKPELTEGEILMDAAYKAKYKIIQKIYGEHKNDTIEFEAYDHNGNPGFANYFNVLLYLSKGKDGKWYHEKYMFNDVYLTKDNKWAGPYEVSDYSHPNNRNTNIKPITLTLKEKVSYNIKGRSLKMLKIWYPSPYYKIKGDSAYLIMGNYIEELFLLKKNGYLKARGLF